MQIFLRTIVLKIILLLLLSGDTVVGSLQMFLR